MPIGLRVLKRRRMIDPALVAAFCSLPVANVSDVMARLTAGGARLRPLHGSGTLAGAALTVKTRPGDNLMVHKAIAMAAPGDVIVVDAGGDLSNALVGEIMITEAAGAGVAGFVIDGAVRDVEAIAAGSFPVYAAGVTHRGPYKDGPGEVNVPVALDGMVVEPGDLILGDRDGVLCVPIDAADAILAAAQAKHAAEGRSLAELAGGRRAKAWVDETLQRIGCEIER